MNALVKVDNTENALIQDLQEPVASNNQVKIEIKVAGICGTDLHILANHYKHTVPVVMGHEFAGVVTDIGDQVNMCSKGDRVVSLTAAVTCGHCDYCSSGILMLCPERKSIGSGVNGAFAKYMVIDQKLIYAIPDNVSYDAAALTEPLACVVHGLLEMARIMAGDLVVISGPGAIGLLSAMVALAEGAQVIVCGMSQDLERLELAEKIGVHKVVNIEQESLGDAMETFSREKLADVVIECAGVQTSAVGCIKAVRPRGRYHQMGLFGRPISIDLDALAYKEVIYSSSYASTPSSFKRSLQLIAVGKVQPELLITNKLPLSLWKQGFDIMTDKQGVKVLLYPD